MLYKYKIQTYVIYNVSWIHKIFFSTVMRGTEWNGMLVISISRSPPENTMHDASDVYTWITINRRHEENSFNRSTYGHRYAYAYRNGEMKM